MTNAMCGTARFDALTVETDDLGGDRPGGPRRSRYLGVSTVGLGAGSEQHANAIGGRRARNVGEQGACSQGTDPIDYFVRFAHQGHDEPTALSQVSGLPIQ